MGILTKWLFHFMAHAKILFLKMGAWSEQGMSLWGAKNHGFNSLTVDYMKMFMCSMICEEVVYVHVNVCSLLPNLQ